MALTITVGDYKVPGTDRVHKGLRFSTIRKTGRKGIWFNMKWCGKVSVSGGANPDSRDSTLYATSPMKAPVLRPTVEGPLSFRLVTSSKQGPILNAGEAKILNFQIGNTGSGPDTFCYLDSKFLDLKKNRIKVTLFAKDSEGKEFRAESIIAKSC